MEPVTALAGLPTALLVGSISPGPSFVLVAQTAVARSRRDGVAAALGMGVGAVVFTTLVLPGLMAVLARVPLLFMGGSSCSAGCGCCCSLGGSGRTPPRRLRVAGRITPTPRLRSEWV